MCEFCSRILDDSGVGWIDDDLITYDPKFKRFYIQVASADPYDTGILEDVKFCPYCGEKLSWKGETNDQTRKN